MGYNGPSVALYVFEGSDDCIIVWVPLVGDTVRAVYHRP